MPKCSCCQEEFETLEDWGSVKLCPQCVKFYEEGLPKKAEKTEMEIKIEKPRIQGGGSYNPWSCELEFKQDHTSFFLSWEEIINHEFLHYLLHRDIGIKCSYQFDNIQNVVDSYHSSI